MCPPATAPLLHISEHCSDEEIFMSLEKFICGGPLPNNVMRDVNPYHYKAENLPYGLWYFIVLQNHIATEHGDWKAIGAPNRIFSNDSICGWKTTYQFCDQRTSNSSRADWLMQEYRITQNGIDDGTTGKDASVLCRVLRNCPSLIEHDLQQGPGLADTSLGTPGNSTHSLDLNSLTRKGEASTSNRQVNNIETAVIVARDNPLNQENVPDADGGDYLEINDLRDFPRSPSSSSGNSSCLTISSNECFDSLGLFQDIENEIIQDLEKNGADHKFNVASVKTDRIVTYTLFPGSSTARTQREIPSVRITNASSSPPSATTDKTAGQTLPKQEIIEERQIPGGNPSERSRSTSASSSNTDASTGENRATGERRKKAYRRSKMLKILCFLPI